MSKKFSWRTTATRIVPTTEEDGYQRVFGAKVLEQKPPVYDNCCATFQVTPKTVFTYGDTLYNPFKLHLSEDLVEHEKVHMGQHKHNETDAALWWGKYLRDSLFRFEQEAMAYGRQYSFICEKVRDRNEQERVLVQLSRILSGPLYGNCTYADEARVMILKFANT